jgi:pyridoxine 5-phosphate synthase
MVDLDNLRANFNELHRISLPPGCRFSGFSCLPILAQAATMLPRSGIFHQSNENTEDHGMPLLGVNVDHVATVRQARLTNEPDPVHAAVLAEMGGADGITVHLREDRRHIQDRDVRLLRQTVRAKLNLEMAVADEITDIAIGVFPDQATLVPERRQEVTTEGGLDVFANRERVHRCVQRLHEHGIPVNLFVDPDISQIEQAVQLEVEAVELHTGSYADGDNQADVDEEFDRLVDAGQFAVSQGLILNMGHGLTYRNVRRVAEINGLYELNIGHSIVAHAILVGFERAVREMKELISVS